MFILKEKQMAIEVGREMGGKEKCREIHCAQWGLSAHMEVRNIQELN